MAGLPGPGTACLSGLLRGLAALEWMQARASLPGEQPWEGTAKAGCASRHTGLRVCCRGKAPRGDLDGNLPDDSGPLCLSDPGVPWPSFSEDTGRSASRGGRRGRCLGSKA